MVETDPSELDRLVTGIGSCHEAWITPMCRTRQGLYRGTHMRGTHYLAYKGETMAKQNGMADP